MRFQLRKIKIRLLSILLLGFTLFFGFFQVNGGQTLQTNHEQKVESLLDLIESGIDANLQAVYSNPKSKELFIELLEMEKLHAQKNNKFALVQKIEEGIVRVNGVGSLAQSLTGTLKTSYNKLISSGLNAVEEGKIIKLFNAENKLVAEIVDNSLIFKYDGWGGNIVTKTDKTTTCIAKFDDQIDKPGSKWIKNELPEGAFGRGSENKSGINILDIDDNTYKALEIEAKDKLIHNGISNPTKTQIKDEANEIFWERYNLPFLEQAFSRGDDIRLLSEPQNLFSSTGFYKREIEVITQGWTKPDGTFIQPLKAKYGYEFNDITKTYEKIN